MKIIKDGKAYVQLKDLSFLISDSGFTIPKSVYVKSLYDVIHMTEHSKNKFFVFTDEDEIELIKKATCIADYDEIKGLSNEEFEELLSASSVELDHLREKKREAKKLMQFHSLSVAYKSEQYKITSCKEARAIKKVKLPKTNKNKLLDFTRKSR
jgi:hypothetical protein